MMDKRRYLTDGEVGKLIAATKGARNEARDRCLLLLMFRHGLRVSEACGLTLSQLDLSGRTLYVSRLKRGLSTTHSLRVDEIKALKAWLVVRDRMELTTDVLFVSERRISLSRGTVNFLVQRYGVKAGLGLHVFPHMLRHACGYALADQGADTRLIQDYLGYRYIRHVTRYTAKNSARFDKVWR